MQTGMFDMNGIEIHTGDLVRFWAWADANDQPHYSEVPLPGYSKCEDHVELVDGRFYAIWDGCVLFGVLRAGGVHLETVAEKCQICGHYVKTDQVAPWWEPAYRARHRAMMV